MSANAQTEDVPFLPTPTPTPTAGAKTSPTPVSIAAPRVSMKPSGNGIVSVTKVVGEVGERFVTSREVKINSAIDQALEQKSAGTDDRTGILLGTERIFPREVGRVLDEWAVDFEARALGSTSSPKAEIAKAVAATENRWKSDQAWKDLDVGTEELHQMIERRMIASDFEKLKSDPALSPVSDDEALAYYKKNRLRFGSLPFSSFEDNIKAFLIKTQVDKRLSEWHEVLRRKYKIRNFVSG